MKRFLLTVPNFEMPVVGLSILGRSFIIGSYQNVSVCSLLGLLNGSPYCFITYRKVVGSLSRNLIKKKAFKNTLQLLKRQYEKPMNELPSRIGTANVVTNVHTERKALNIIVSQSLI